MVIYALCEALHCRAGNVRSVLLHEIIKDILCINPVNAEK